MKEAGQSTPLGPWVRSGAMRGVVSFLERINLDPLEVVGVEGIRMAEATDPYRKVDLITVLQAFQKVVDVSGRVDLVLELGLAQRMEEWGPFGHLFLNAPNVQEALKDLCRYGRALQSHASFGLISNANEIAVEYSSNHPELSGWELDTEISITFLMSIVNAVAAAGVQPREIWFEHHPIHNPALYYKHLHLEPCFGARCNRVTYHRSVAQRSSAAANPELYVILKRHVRDLALAEGESEKEQLISFVRNNISRGLTQGTATLEHVSAEIGLEPRTLQRRLKEQGSNFQSLVEKVRLSRAIYLLEKTTLSITDVALELGYADASVFIRAFKRLTGSSPKQYRKQKHS